MAFFNTFKTGDVVPTSGSYAALHSTPHKLLERAVHVEGERFEPCKLCPLGVLYRLEQPGCRLLCLPTAVMKPWCSARFRLRKNSWTAEAAACNKRPASD
jgi:hypothetical protein